MRRMCLFFAVLTCSMMFMATVRSSFFPEIPSDLHDLLYYLPAEPNQCVSSSEKEMVLDFINEMNCYCIDLAASSGQARFNLQKEFFPKMKKLVNLGAAVKGLYFYSSQLSMKEKWRFLMATRPLVECFNKYIAATGETVYSYGIQMVIDLGIWSGYYEEVQNIEGDASKTSETVDEEQLARAVIN